MNILNAITQNLTATFEGNNWTDVDIASAINDITFDEAITQTNASPNTIASLTHHLFFWNGIIMKRLKGNNPSGPENGYNISHIKTENDWNDLKEKTHQSFIDLANAIKNFAEEKLNETYAEGKSSYYKNITGIIEHAYYHLGQITILKRIVKRLDNTQSLF